MNVSSLIERSGNQSSPRWIYSPKSSLTCIWIWSLVICMGHLQADNSVWQCVHTDADLTHRHFVQIMWPGPETYAADWFLHLFQDGGQSCNFGDYTRFFCRFSSQVTAIGGSEPDVHVPWWRCHRFMANWFWKEFNLPHLRPDNRRTATKSPAENYSQLWFT